jgi:hypothetical protein
MPARFEVCHIGVYCCAEIDSTIAKAMERPMVWQPVVEFWVAGAGGGHETPLRSGSVAMYNFEPVVC